MQLHSHLLRPAAVAAAQLPAAQAVRELYLMEVQEEVVLILVLAARYLAVAVVAQAAHWE